MDSSMAAVEAVATPATDEAWRDTSARLTAELDRIEKRFRGDDVIAGMRDIRDTLLSVRAGVTREEWLSLCAETVMTHPIAELILKCPLTRRSNEKPRGYPGDAPLLDLIYGIGDNLQIPHPATIEGQVHFFVVHSSACRAVRRRREIIAGEISKAVRNSPGAATILSVAGGHLREAELLDEETRRGIREFHVLDQDADSLAEVSAKYAALLPLNPIGKTVRSVLLRHTKFSDLDYIYSAGLFDYLVAPVGMRLIERLFEMLKPGGRLLIANFTPALEDIGYMETFMDWRLIYRTVDEVRALFDGLPQEDVASLEAFTDEKGVVAYVAVRKKI